MDFNYDSKYLYLLHGTSKNDVSTLEDMFNNGLISYRGNSLFSTMMPLQENDIKSTGLSLLMKNYIVAGKYQTAYLIKIPKQYLSSYLYKNGRVNAPVPLWKPTEKKGEYNRKIAVFTPHLIAGAYNPSLGGYVENTNYTPIFDPGGLQYSNEQIDNLLNYDQMDWVSYARSRENCTFEQLYQHDQQTGTWNNIMQLYTKEIKFSKQPKKFEMAPIKNTDSKTLPNPKLYPQYDFSFDGLKQTFDNYNLQKDEHGQLVATDKKSGIKVTDQLVIARVKFAQIWFKANSFKGNGDGFTLEYQYSFNDGARKTYDAIMNLMQQQLLNTGNIDIMSIKQEANVSSYKWSAEIIANLFSNDQFTQAVVDWAHKATPKALPQTLSADSELSVNSKNGISR